jgi:hypothetical protein
MKLPYPLNVCSAACAALGLAAALACGPAGASTVSLQGSFQNDDELFVIHFKLDQGEQVSASSFSFGGGLNAAGQTIASGGFAPVLTLFLQGFGPLVLARGSSRTCGAGSGNADPTSGFCWDANFSEWLSAGEYDLVLSQDGNEALGQSLAEGYQRTGEHDYTGWDYLGQADRRFVQVDGTQRTGFWALDITGAPIDLPEPGTALLALLGGLCLSVGTRQRQNLARLQPA